MKGGPHHLQTLAEFDWLQEIGWLHHVVVKRRCAKDKKKEENFILLPNILFVVFVCFVS